MKWKKNTVPPNNTHKQKIYYIGVLNTQFSFDVSGVRIAKIKLHTILYTKIRTVSYTRPYMDVK